MHYKIVSDSSSNIFKMEDINYQSVPLKIITDKAEYIDDENLNVLEMTDDLKKYKGKSGSSCPNIHEWGKAFEDSDAVFAITISGNLSGSYQAALQASEEYLENNPQGKIHVINSLSVGPEMQLIMEKLRVLINKGLEFDKIKDAAAEYSKHTHLLFGLRSLNNLAHNGRINPAIAKACSILGIRILGKASDEGTLQTLEKCRGEKKLILGFLEQMEAHNFNGGRVIISHCFNEEAANSLKEIILKKYPECNVRINSCAALCSFYAEEGGLIVGFEDKDA